MATQDLNPQAAVITKIPKSVGIAILLTFLFGPLGMLYSTVSGGIIMIIVAFVVAVISAVTGGIGGLLFFPLWIVSIIWGGIAAHSHNKTLLHS